MAPLFSSTPATGTAAGARRLPPRRLAMRLTSRTSLRGSAGLTPRRPRFTRPPAIFRGQAISFNQPSNAGNQPPRAQRRQRQASRMKATLFAVGCIGLFGCAHLPRPPRAATHPFLPLGHSPRRLRRCSFQLSPGDAASSDERPRQQRYHAR